MGRELARELGDKGTIVFSDFEQVILKSMSISSLGFAISKFGS